MVQQSRTDSGEVVKTVRVAYSNSLKERNPAAAELLENVSIEAQTLSELIYAIVVQGGDTDEVIGKWIDDGPEKSMDGLA